MSNNHNHKVHLYQKVLTSNGKVKYKCTKPGCTHFVYKDLIVGRLCECYICEQPFELTKKLLSNRTNIKCPDCRANIPIDKRQSKLDNLGKGLTVEEQNITKDNKDIIESTVTDILEGIFKS